jgi:heme A synthase
LYSTSQSEAGTTNADQSSRPGSGSLRWLALATALATYALIIVGAVVRATGSGDACPDWPRCHGQLIPPLQTDVLIEFSHRLLASVVGFLVLATAIGAWRIRRAAPVVFWGSVLAVVLVGGQIVLGGATVLSDLSPGVVTAHLAMAATLLATLLLITLLLLAPMGPATGSRSAASLRTFAVVVALATFALMLTGSYVSGTGAGLAFRDWPLFDGQLMPEGGRLAMIHATHRFAALAIGLLLGALAFIARRSGEKGVVHGAGFALTLYVAQALVGAANIWTLLQPAAIAAHVALGSLLWATLVAVAYFAQRGAGWPAFALAAKAAPSTRVSAAVESS